MDKVRLALVLITIAITVVPTLGIVLAYRDNLAGLIIPPEINQINNNLQSSVENATQPEQTGPVDVHYDAASRTFTASFQFKNPLPFDATLKIMTGTIVCDEHTFNLGTATLKNPVSMSAGSSVTVTIQGTWTQEGIDHLQTAHQGEKSVKVSLVDTTINLGGLTTEVHEPISVGDIPLT